MGDPRLKTFCCIIEFGVVESSICCFEQSFSVAFSLDPHENMHVFVQNGTVERIVKSSRKADVSVGVLEFVGVRGGGQPEGEYFLKSGFRQRVDGLFQGQRLFVDSLEAVVKDTRDIEEGFRRRT